MARKPKKLTPVADRFMDLDRFQRLSRFNPATGCVEWQGSRNNVGYGLVGYRDSTGKARMQSAHRAAWMIHHGTTIPPGMEVQHTCHNKLCVTPEHLITGTHQQKMKAMMAENRHGFQLHPGSRAITPEHRRQWHLHYDATRIYSREEIQWIRAATHEEIAERYNTDMERARAMRRYMRCGYPWLPYDRAGTRLKTGRKMVDSSVDQDDQDPVN